MGFRYEKSSGRATLLEAIYSLTSVLKSSENSPISRKILRGWRMKTGDFERELVKLELLSSPYSLERNPDASSIPAEYVLEITSVFGRFIHGS